MNIGKSVVIKGELNGSEDLTIEGRVEGTIDLRENVLTIGPNGKIKAQVFAKSVIVLGSVTGNITASEKIDIRDGGIVEGDLVSPRVGISEGAHFRGTVDMQKKAQPGQRPGNAQDKPSQPSDVMAKRQDAPACTRCRTLTDPSPPLASAFGATNRNPSHGWGFVLLRHQLASPDPSMMG